MLTAGSLALPAALFFSGMCWSIFTPNPELTIAVFLAMAVIQKLTWRPGELPVLFFCVATQWAEVSTSVFHANLAGISVDDMTDIDTFAQSIWLGLAGLILVSLGIRLSLWGFRAVSEWRFRQETVRLNIDKVFWFYIALFLFSIFCKGIMWIIPGSAQIFAAFFSLRWVFYILLAYITLYQGKKRLYILLAFMLEMAVGMISFFSEFKLPMILLAMVYLSLGRRLTFGRFFKATAISMAMLMLGVLWTNVKSDYRGYINEGTGQQLASVPVMDRFKKILELYQNIEIGSLGSGVEGLAKRVSYVEFFAMTLHNVPTEISHEGGLLLGNAIQHVLTPRILNPDKPIVDQTALTTKYTGIRFAENTSVNLGYMAEYYIDFGVFGILLGTLMTGFAVGSIYRYFIGQRNVGLFNYILACVVALPFNNFGTNLVILVGGLTMSFLVMAILLKFIVPFMERLLRSKERVIG